MSFFVMFVISALVAIIFAPKPQSQNAEASQFDASNFPEAKDKPIAHVFGRTLIEAPNTIYAGRFRADPIKVKQDGGLFGGSSTSIVGYKYYATMDMALCFGEVELLGMHTPDSKIKLDAQPMPPTGILGDVSTNINKDVLLWGFNAGTPVPEGPDLHNSYGATVFRIRSISSIGTQYRYFIPESAIDYNIVNVRGLNMDKEWIPMDPPYPRISRYSFPHAYRYDIEYTALNSDTSYGDYRFYPGSQTQNADSLMQQYVSADYPTYRGLAHIVMDDFYVGQSPNLEQISFEVARYPKSPTGLNTHLEKVGYDANPAYVIYELITSNLHSGISTDLVDVNSFESVAQVLYDEGVGISFTWSQVSDYNTLINKICDHCELVKRENHVTGKIEIVAVRPDYNVDNLFTLDDSNIQVVQDFTKPSIDAINTEIRVKYKDRVSKYNERNVISHNIGTINNKRQRSQINRDYSFFTSPGLAQWAADRDLASMTNDISSVKLTTNRDASALNLGDPVKVKLPEFDDFYRVYRVQSIDLGSLENNRISLDLIEDVFGRSPKLYAGIGSQDPSLEPPKNAKDVGIVELPNDVILAFVAKSDDGGVHDGYRVNYKLNTGTYTHVNPGDPQEYSVDIVLDSDVAASDDFMPAIGDTASALLEPVALEDREQGASLAVIVNPDGDHEFVSYGMVSDSQGNVLLSDLWRGIYDTQPMDLKKGARVYLTDSPFYTIKQGANEAIDDPDAPPPPSEYLHYFRASPIVDGEALDFADTDEYIFAETDRYKLPNSPINGTAVDDTNGDMVLSWNRRSNDYSVVKQDQVVAVGSVRVRIYDFEGGAMLHEEVVEGDTMTWTNEIQEIPQEPVYDENGDEIPQDPVYTERYPSLYVEIHGYDAGELSRVPHVLTHTRA